MTVADITTELATIAGAQYGRDVRTAMHDGLRKVNDGLNGLEITTQDITNLTLPASGYSSILITPNGTKFPISVALELTTRTSQAILVGAPIKDGNSYDWMAVRLYNIHTSENTITSGKLIITWAQLN